MKSDLTYAEALCNKPPHSGLQVYWEGYTGMHCGLFMISYLGDFSVSWQILQGNVILYC